MQFAISAHINRTVDGWESTHHLPTFVIDAIPQGALTPAAAEWVARRIIDPFGTYGENLKIIAYEL